MALNTEAAIARLDEQVQSLARDLKEHREEFRRFIEALERQASRDDAHMEKELEAVRKALEQLSSAVRKNDDELAKLRTSLRVISWLGALALGAVTALRHFTDLLR